jgi:hypothetical protein
MRVALIGIGATILGAGVLGLIVALALAIREQTPMMTTDCGLPGCQPQGPEGIIVFALVAGLAVGIAVVEARRG